MKFKFEKLIIWQNAMEFGENVYQIFSKFTKDETFKLTSQIHLSADSIALNISEGSIEQSIPEFKKFVGYAIRSLAEVVTCLHKANKRSYITKSEFEQLYDYSFNLMNMTVAFKHKLN